MDVSIIIVNYNTTQLLLNCIKTIYQNTKDDNFEIIVVDNNSSNRDIEKLKDEYPKVNLILHSDNVGFGRANNLAADSAKGEYLFFLNPDTLLLNDSIRLFLDFFKFNDKSLPLGVIGSILLDENCDVNASYSNVYDTFFNEIINSLKSSFFGKKRKERLLIQDYKEVAWVSGADLFIKKSSFNEVGKFDQNIFMYYEEVDLQKRLNNLGLKNYIVNGPKIIHLEGGSFESNMTINKKKIIDKSKFYFYKKYSKNSFTYFLNKELYMFFSWIKIYKDHDMKEAFNYIKFLNSL